MSLTPAERGRLGGQATYQRHGSMHVEAIGRAGFETTALRYYGGDARAYMDALRERQAEGQPDPRLGCRVQRPASI